MNQECTTFLMAANSKSHNFQSSDGKGELEGVKSTPAPPSPGEKTLILFRKT
jgi:hypothetical protein